MTSRSMLLGTLVAASLGVTLPAAAAETPDTSVRGAVIFWLLDRNGDGAVDQKEIAALRTAVFDALDTNRDGHLTKDEAKALAEAGRAHVAERIAAAIKDGPAKLAERHEKFAERLGLDAPDGIARAEFVARKAPAFARADTDGSGSISKSEFEAAAGNLRQLMMPN